MIIKDRITTEEVVKLGAQANFSSHISLSRVGNYEIYISSTGVGNASVSVFVDAWHTRIYGSHPNLFCFLFCLLSSCLLFCLA